jgi:hypothetical protein
MKAVALALFAVLSLSIGAAAQAPFDMSTEKPAQTPSAQIPPGQIPFGQTPSSPASPPPGQSGTQPAGPAASSAQAAARLRRYLVPFASLVLPGESARRSWAVYLTAQQAASPASLSLGYQNAIVVAPEASRLKLSINGTRLIDTAVESPNAVSELDATVPQGLLRPGFNELTVDVEQRHRTDCTVQSTYELWTQIDPKKTFLTFSDAAAGQWKGIDDIRATGVDEKGTTGFSMIVPALGQSVATAPSIRLAEALAIMSQMPNQVFDMRAKPDGQSGPGQATVVMGTASEVSSVLTVLPTGAETAPTIAMMDDPRTGASTLVVTGPTWQAVGSAVDDIAKQFDQAAGNPRVSLSTQSWHLPDIPMFFSSGRIKFSDLGASTQEFSGRRFKVDFSLGIPSDFYAGSYGHMTLLLDAAYSDQVEPGSHIDVYVNDNIAATVPITTNRGEILRHLPIPVTMRHFRPGDNTISLEAILHTQADAVCAPGAPASGNSRFVLFDTSEVVMPTFARVGRIPNLSATSGTAFPYRTQDSVPLVVDSAQPETLSAAMTLMARMSVAAGYPIPVDPTATVSGIASRPAIFIGPVSQIPSTVMSQVGVSSEGNANWGAATAPDGPSTDATFSQWRERLSGSGWRGQVSSFQDWLNRTFNISGETLRLLPGSDHPFSPQPGSALLVAQHANPTETGTWTVVAAPDAAKLKDGVERLARYGTWRQLAGRITTIDVTGEKIEVEPVERFELVETQPFSLANYRLILANWLSANTLSYALLLTVLSILLGLATAGLMRSLGRRL